jgi:hypothetical protein
LQDRRRRCGTAATAGISSSTDARTTPPQTTAPSRSPVNVMSDRGTSHRVAVIGQSANPPAPPGRVTGPAYIVPRRVRRAPRPLRRCADHPYARRVGPGRPATSTSDRAGRPQSRELAPGPIGDL